MNNKKSTGLLLSILGVISLVLITAGVTYAFFSYTKEGLTENTITTGTITFHYDEKEGEGNGINITDALPMSDTEGKALSGDNNVFNFNITSTVTGNANIPYTITVRKNNESTLAEDQIKIYLETEAAGTNYTVDETGVVALFSDLDEPTDIELPENTVEKAIFEATVGANADYDEDFVLRMCIDGEENAVSDYSPYEFVAKSAVTAANGAALNIDTLEAGTDQVLTSTEYYALDDAARANYERIAYVNYTDGTVYTVSQAAAEGFAAGEGFEAHEQFYPLNSQTFKVTVNVYANAVVVNEGE